MIHMKPGHGACAVALLALLTLAACNKKPEDAAPASPPAPAAAPAPVATPAPAVPAPSGNPAPVSSMPVEGSQSMTTGPISPKQ